MIDIVQWRNTIGSFNWKFKCYIGHKLTNNTFENGMMHIAVNDWFDIAVLYVNLLHIAYDWFDAVLHVKGMLHTALNDWFDFAVLHMPVFIIYVVSMLVMWKSILDLCI